MPVPYRGPLAGLMLLSLSCQSAAFFRADPEMYLSLSRDGILAWLVLS
jgi:hypothetical protein